MKKVLLLLLIAVTQFVKAQGLIGTSHSLVLVYNLPGNWFYIELEGKEKNRTERPNIFIIDSKPVQVVVVHKKSFFEENTDLSDKEIIEKYVRWEEDYIESSLQFELINQLEFIPSELGRCTAFWTYDMPLEIQKTDLAARDSSQTVPSQKQLFAITKVKDCIVGVSTSLFEENTFDFLKSYLLQQVGNITEEQKEIDMEELNKKINPDVISQE